MANLKRDKFFITLYDGKNPCVIACFPTDRDDIQVKLTPEELIMLECFDVNFFGIVDKFVQAGFDLGKKVASKSKADDDKERWKDLNKFIAAFYSTEETTAKSEADDDKEKRWECLGLKSLVRLIKTREALSQTMFANQLCDAIAALNLTEDHCQFITDHFQTGDNLAEAFAQSKKMTMTDFLLDWLREQGHED